MKLLHIIADYSAGDLAFSEMISALARHLPDDYRWHPTAVDSFNTISTGFAVGQLGLQDESLRAKDTVIYANCAPRKDLKDKRHNNEGEGLLYGVLNNGVQIVIVNSGYSLSFVRDEIKELWSVNVERGGSQFRSRDVFPPVVGKVCHHQSDFRGAKLDPLQVIPEVPRGVVAYIDSFGNMKTTFRTGDPELADLKSGQRIGIHFDHGRSKSVFVATENFNVDEGDIAFAPGSSGHSRRYWELFHRGGSAWETFSKPVVGAQVVIER